MNVFDMRGPEFLQFYFVLLVVVTVAAFACRWSLRGPWDDLPIRGPVLDPFQWAYLSGGPKGAVNAAVVSLVKRGALRVRHSAMEIANPLDRTESAFETAIFNAVAKGYYTVDVLKNHLPESLPRLARPLENSQLVFGLGAFPPARLVPGVLVAAVAATGGIKVAIGLSRHRPVGFLVVLTLIAFVLTFLTTRPVFRTVRGDRLLARTRREQAALRATSRTASESLAPMDLALATALYADAALTHKEMRDVRKTLYPRRPVHRNSCSGASCGGAISHSSASSCSSSSCSGGSSCGGGGGGCGGCGGGGS